MLISGTLGGLAVSEKYFKRVDFLRSYINFLIYLKNEIQYSQKNILEIIKSYSVRGDLNTYFTNFIENMEKNSFQKSWVNAFSGCSSVVGIDLQEEKEVLNFSKNFGSCDIKGQVTYLNHSLKTFENFLNIALESKKKKGNIPVVVGVGMSLCTALLFI